ncbi:bridge-like lipid transfer protein family member 1 isoform X2 [Symsagittifera roscoffensis]|uniref:bridge-like lipid transfer protein family member 1 isoform X2 n=1 Tax=Symsagittifera roscoffensis TaxID=84072 RepID=UPI00307C65B0
MSVVADEMNLFVCHQFNLAHDHDPRGSMGGVMGSGFSSSFGYGFGDSSRKDAFSLSVRSLRLNMCRNSVLHMLWSPPPSTAASASSDPLQGGYPFHPPPHIVPDNPSRSGSRDTNVTAGRYRFIDHLLIVDFGECHFKFDIRKLNELRTFLKFWYRKNLMTRAFTATAPEEDDISIPDMDDYPATAPFYTEAGDDLGGWYSGDDGAKGPADIRRRSTPQQKRKSTKTYEGLPSSITANRKSTLFKYGGRLLSSPVLTGSDSRSGGGGGGGGSRSFSSNSCPTLQQQQQLRVKWESNVRIAVNFPFVEVNLQLESFLGSIKVRTERLCANGLLHLDSTSNKVASTNLTLGRSELSSIAAAINPSIQLTDWNVQLTMRRPPQGEEQGEGEVEGEEPTHRLHVHLAQSDCRLNYKSIPILMLSCQHLKMLLTDHWSTTTLTTTDSSSSDADRSSADDGNKKKRRRRGRRRLCLRGDVGWDCAQVLAVQSTLSDLIIVKYRLMHVYSVYFNTRPNNKSPAASRSHSLGSNPAGTQQPQQPQQQQQQGYRGFASHSGQRRSMDTAQSVSSSHRKLDWRRHWPQVLSQMQQTSPPHGVGVNNCSTATGRAAPAAANRVNNRGGIRQLGRAMGLKWGQDATDMELSGQVEIRGDELSVVVMEGDIRSTRWLTLSLSQPLLTFDTHCNSCPHPRHTHSLNNNNKNNTNSSNKQNKTNTASGGTHPNNHHKGWPSSDVDSEGGGVVVVKQSLSARLLHDPYATTDKKRDLMMAEVKLCHRVGDGSCPVMVSSSVHEWFAHTLYYTPPDKSKARSVYYKVESSLIASLPRLETSLRTEQVQTMGDPNSLLPQDVAAAATFIGSTSRRSPPQPTPVRPRVECDFSAVLHQPMQVALDPQYIEVIRKLIKDCGQRVKSATSDSKGAPSAMRKAPKPGDPREYNVREWTFDPSVKFITNTTSSTDPPGMNWVWRKLGIENCKHSVPKFSQRTVMDPLDSAVARAVLYDMNKLSLLHHKLPDVVEQKKEKKDKKKKK